MKLLSLFLIVLVCGALAQEEQDENLVEAQADVGAESEPNGCPTECECEDDNISSVYTVTCYDVTDFAEIDFVRPDMRDLIIEIKDSNIDFVNSDALANLASSKLTIKVSNSEIGMFRANSLDVEGAAIRLSLEFEDVVIGKFEADAMTQGDVGAMIFRNTEIDNIAAEAFSSIRFNIIDWTDVTVNTMHDNALNRGSVETLILTSVTFGGGYPFSGMDRIARLQFTESNFPLFPQHLIPQNFVPDEDHATNTYMHNNNFRTIETYAFQDADLEQNTLQADQFYRNTVQCDSRLDWLTTDTPPSYVPIEFYESLICSAPEAFCGAKLHTCTTVGTIGDPNCDFIDDFNCDDINGAAINTLGATVIALVMTVYAFIA